MSSQYFTNCLQFFLDMHFFMTLALLHLRLATTQILTQEPTFINFQSSYEHASYVNTHH